MRSTFAGAAGLLTVVGALALTLEKGLTHPVAVAAMASPVPVNAEAMRSETTPRAPPPVSTPRAAGEEFVGVILARASADITPRFEGRLQEVRVRMGDRVSAGAVLAVLDAPALRFDLRMAEASSSTAQVDEARTAVELEEAKERLGRKQSLAAERLISIEELVSAQYQEKLAATRLAGARAQVAERRSQVERLQKDNSDLQITAPFEGIVAIRYVDPGATVRPATPILRLISLSDVFVRFAVPEARLRAMAIGQAVRVHVGEGRRELRGTIERVAPEVDAASHLVFLEARLPPLAPEIAALSGEIARVSPMESP